MRIFGTSNASTSTFGINNISTSNSGPNTSAAGISTSTSDSKTYDASTFNADTLNRSTLSTSTLDGRSSGTNQEPLTLAPLVPFFSVKSDGGEHEKLPEQVNIFGAFTDGDKDKNIILTQFLIQMHNDIPEASTNRFTTYYPHYKKKPRMIEFVYNPFFSGYCQNYYHYLITYLTALSNLELITYTIKNSWR